MSKRRPFILGAAASLASAWAFFRSYRAYRADLSAARARIARAKRVLPASQGTLIYGEAGSGPPVMVIHGSGGGFNQALFLTQSLTPGFRRIAPSRFGYLGTPLPEDASPAAQAEAYIALLDALGIGRLPVIAHSAGGPSALQFALRHPERCAGLVMVSAVSKGMIDVSPNPDTLLKIFDWLLAGDYRVWLLMQLVQRRLAPSLGVPLSLIRSLDETQQRWLQTWLNNMLPVDVRRTGWVNDYRQILHLELLPLEQISVPTLILHARDDSLVALERHARFCAATIPGARLVVLPRGGHLLLGQRAAARQAIQDFLASLPVHPSPHAAKST